MYAVDSREGGECVAGVIWRDLCEATSYFIGVSLGSKLNFGAVSTDLKDRLQTSELGLGGVLGRMVGMIGVRAGGAGRQIAY